MTRTSKTGQPVMGTTVEVELTTDDVTFAWTPCTVVGKFYGKGGNSHLVGLIVETPDGGRLPIQPHAWRRTRPEPAATPKPSRFFTGCLLCNDAIAGGQRSEPYAIERHGHTINGRVHSSCLAVMAERQASG